MLTFRQHKFKDGDIIFALADGEIPAYSFWLSELYTLAPISEKRLIVGRCNYPKEKGGWEGV